MVIVFFWTGKNIKFDALPSSVQYVCYIVKELLKNYQRIVKELLKNCKKLLSNLYSINLKTLVKNMLTGSIY